MHINVPDLFKKYSLQKLKWSLPKKGDKQRKKIPLHIDSHRLFLIFQYYQ